MNTFEHTIHNILQTNFFKQKQVSAQKRHIYVGQINN